MVAFVDPQAKICWPVNLYPQIKSGLTLGSLMGPGSGEPFQLAFHGPGFVVVQPSRARAGRGVVLSVEPAEESHDYSIRSIDRALGDRFKVIQLVDQQGHPRRLLVPPPARSS